MILLPNDLRAQFEGAGWFPGRHVAVTGKIPEGHPAVGVLTAFSGLKVGRTGRGLECATSDIHFMELDEPELDTVEFEESFGDRLVAIGEAHAGHSELYIGLTGHCFSYAISSGAICLAGLTIEAALRGLLTGLRERPILMPGQSSVTLYGDTYLAGDPAFYDPTLPVRA